MVDLMSVYTFESVSQEPEEEEAPASAAAPVATVAVPMFDDSAKDPRKRQADMVDDDADADDATL